MRIFPSEEAFFHSADFLSFVPADPRYSIKSTGSLVITSVTNSDRALYTCIVKNKAGQASKSIRVRVRPASTESSSTDTTSESTFRSLSLSKSQNLSHCVEYGDISFGDSLPLVNQISNVSSSSKPQFTTRPHDCVQTREGYSIVLSCTAQGHPDATVQWSKEGELMEVSSEVRDCTKCSFVYCKVVGDP